MKKYIALKTMKFDKSYQKGTEVPENVIAKEMRNKLVRCGALAVEITAEQEKKPEEQNIEETEKTPEEQNTEETEKTPEQQEQINQISEQQTEQTPQPQTEEQLLQYKKEELEQMAQQKGIEVKQSMTKADIVALLLQEE